VRADSAFGGIPNIDSEGERHEKTEHKDGSEAHQSTQGESVQRSARNVSCEWSWLVSLPVFGCPTRKENEGKSPTNRNARLDEAETSGC